MTPLNEFLCSAIAYILRRRYILLPRHGNGKGTATQFTVKLLLPKRLKLKIHEAHK